MDGVLCFTVYHLSLQGWEWRWGYSSCCRRCGREGPSRVPLAAATWTLNLPSLGVSLCHRIGTMVPSGLSVGLRIIKHADCTGGVSAAEKRWMATNKVQLPVLWKARITRDKSEIHKEDEIQQHSPEFT